MRAVRMPRRGELQSAENVEAYNIWRSRNVEPELCDPFGLRSDYISDPERDIQVFVGREMWLIAVKVLRSDELQTLFHHLVYGRTLAETGEAIGLSGESARRIALGALSKLRRASLHRCAYSSGQVRTRAAGAVTKSSNQGTLGGA